MSSPQPDRLSVLVIDDESPARQRLADLLRQDDSVGQIQEADDGHGAVQLIHDTAPDLVFLDVQMPELNGLGVIEAVGVGRMPLTVFVTAYDEHAVRAFELNVVDYLLKPFSDERFESMMARARLRLGHRNVQKFGENFLRMIAAMPIVEKYLDRFVVKRGGATQFIKASDVDWIEGAGVYVNLHVDGKGILYRASLTYLSENLNPSHFVRIHRSAIVNVDSIVRLEPVSHGEFEVIMRDGAVTRVSRAYRTNLEKRLRQSL